jgi:glutathione S-transferase
MATPHLVTIAFSHYCEKARWALERAGITYRESAHLPAFHILGVRRAGGRRSTPILVTDEGILNDSTDIAKWADRHAPKAHLYGKTEAERKEVEQLEDHFDEELGPHTRRWFYFHALPKRDLVVRLCQSQEAASRTERAAIPFLFPLARVVMRKSMRITPKGAERSLRKIVDVLSKVDQRLADGRRYLVGDQPTVADITFACLVGVLLSPPEYGAKLPSEDELPTALAASIRGWRAQPSGAFALRMFHDHRRGSG